MEEKDVSNIASAVSRELAKLNAEKPPEKEDKKDDKKEIEVFNCPECGGIVSGGIPYCSHCGCALEWEA